MFIIWNAIADFQFLYIFLQQNSKNATSQILRVQGGNFEVLIIQLTM